MTLGFSGVSKVYDGTTNASVTLNYNNSIGPYSVDSSGLSVSSTAIYTGSSAKNVGTGKAIAVSGIVLSGQFAGNYTVGNTTASTTGTVTTKPITLSGITATDRAYDGTTTVQVSASGTIGSSGFVPGDIVSVSPPSGGLTTGTTVNKNIGSNKPVTVTGLTLSGADATNYAIDPTGSGITVNITAAALTPTFSGGTRAYDGSVAASVTSTTSGVFGTDVVTIAGNAVFTGTGAKDVGTNKPIGVTGITLSGSGAANYSLAGTTATSTGGITAKLVTVAYTGGSRVYNGLLDTSAPVVGNSLQFIAGDAVGLAQTALFTGDGSVGTNKAVTISGISLTGAQAGNYSLSNTSASTTATITPRQLGVTGITATNRVYDGTTTVAVNTTNATVDLSNVIGSDQVSAVLPPGGISFGSMADRNAGNNKTVNVTGISLTGSAASNYVAVGATGLTVNISALAVNASFLAANKVYNGNATAVISGSSASFLSVDASSVGIAATGLFTAGKNVGTGLAVNVSGAFLTGASRDNYSLLNTSGSTSADITARTVGINFGGQSKVYDGTTSASVFSNLSNVVSGDQLSTTQSALFTDSKNVGNGKPIAVSNVALSGTDAGNYLLPSSFSTSTTGSITAKPITVSGLSNVTAQDRIYNGLRTVNVTVPVGVTLTPSSTDIVPGDNVQINVPTSGVISGTMANKNVGNNKTVTVDGLTLTGGDAINYSIIGTTGVRVNITPLSVAATFAGVNRVYNGNTSASVTGTSSGLITGDSVTVSGSGFFTDSKNVGTAKPINVTSALLSGTDAVNYVLTTTTGSASADVTRLFLTPTFTGSSRVYDGTANAPVQGSYNFVAGDNVTMSGTGLFAGSASTAKNVGTGKAISVSGISLVGTDAANYGLLATTASTTGTITPRSLTLTGLTGVSARSRNYDGTTTVQIDVQSSGGTVGLDRSNVIGSDDVDVAQLSGNITTGTVADKNVGSNKPVAVTGLALTGADAGNYTVGATQGVTVSITQKPITATFTGQNKVYDGTNAATLLGSSSDFVAGDTVSVSGSGIFVAGKNAGTGLQMSVTGGTLAGTDARNYTLLNPSGTAVANITPKAVTATWQGSSRVYDGTLAAPVNGTLAGLITGDSVSLGRTAVFGDKNAGANKTVSISAISLQGGDAANYSLSGGSSATATATITPRPIGVLGLTGVTAQARDYDGTLSVSVNISNTGTVSLNQADIISGDLVSITGPTNGAAVGTMLDKNAGSNKPVTVPGLVLGGTDAANYSVASTSGVTVSIRPKDLTAIWTGVNKVYDGTASATLAGSSLDILGGDVVTIGGSGSFAAGKNVGNGLAINVSGGALAGADAINYSLLNSSGTASANITPRALTASYSGGTRVYDGTTAAPVTRSLTGVISGDSVSVGETAAFASKNVGNGLTISVSSISLSGADSGNYALAGTSASTTGSITPRNLNVSGLTGITAVDRAYNGSTGVQVNIVGNPGTASGDVLAGDDVQINVAGTGLGQGQMLDKHVGTSKPVSLSGLVLSGTDAGNYNIAGVAGVTVNITPINVTVAGLAAINRIYDGTSVVGINTSLGSLSGALAGDDVQLLTTGATASMADKNAGQGKAVNLAGLTMGGADARDYRVVSTGPGLTVNITPRALIAGLTTADKIYDGSTGTGSGLGATLFDDRIAGDALSLSATNIAFASRNAGTGIAVTASGLTLSGADAGNYVFGNSTVTGTGTIRRAALTLNANSLSKVYGNAATLGYATQGLVSGETLGTVTMTSAGAAATAAASPSPYAITAAIGSGGSYDPANYDLTVVNGSLTVTVRPLTIAGSNTLRYENDPNRLAGLGFSSSVGGLVNGDLVDTVTLSVPSAAATAAGGSRPFTLGVSNAHFASGSASNYSITYVPGSLAILPVSRSGTSFAIELDPLEVANAGNELRRASRIAREFDEDGPALPGTGISTLEASAADLAALLSGDGRRINLPALQKMPLISLDPELRRILSNTDTTAAP